MKDSFWVAVAYGIVSQAQTMNVNMNLYEAGGYENLRSSSRSSTTAWRAAPTPSSSGRFPAPVS